MNSSAIEKKLRSTHAPHPHALHTHKHTRHANICQTLHRVRIKRKNAPNQGDGEIIMAHHTEKYTRRCGIHAVCMNQTLPSCLLLSNPIGYVSRSMPKPAKVCNNFENHKKGRKTEKMFKDGGLRGVLVERELLSKSDGLKFRVMGVALTCCLRWFPLAQQSLFQIPHYMCSSVRCFCKG